MTALLYRLSYICSFSFIEPPVVSRDHTRDLPRTWLSLQTLKTRQGPAADPIQTRLRETPHLSTWSHTITGESKDHLDFPMVHLHDVGEFRK